MGIEPNSPRVFVGPVEIAGYYSGIAEALREAGLDVLLVDLSRHIFEYPGERQPALPVRLATRTTARREATAKGRPSWFAWTALDVAARVLLLGWSMYRFDAFIFGFGQTFLGGYDLPILRLVGKRLVFAFNGSDARPSYVDGAELPEALSRPIDNAIRLARRKKRRIRRIERYADAIVSQPAFSHFFERPVVDFFRIGVPIPGPTRSVVPLEPRTTIRILHSPSNPEVKGSAKIRETIEKLRGEGLALEFVELRGVPNRVVREEVERADFVIDQLYSDAPMVGFATEAAAAGRAAIVGGYAWPQLQEIYRDGAMPPVEACHPEQLESAILRLATDRDYRLALGARAREFATTAWSREAIAARYVALLRGEIRDEWLFDPRQLRYVRGVGMPEERARRLVAGVVSQGGRAALQLGDKPGLEQAFVDFAAGR